MKKAKFKGVTFRTRVEFEAWLKKKTKFIVEFSEASFDPTKWWIDEKFYIAIYSLPFGTEGWLIPVQSSQGIIWSFLMVTNSKRPHGEGMTKTASQCRHWYPIRRADGQGECSKITIEGSESDDCTKNCPGFQGFQEQRHDNSP